MGTFCRALLLVLLLALPAVVRAQFNYTTTNGTITITGYTGSDVSVIIPSTIDSLPVTSIGAVAFLSCSSLIWVTVGDTVTSIGASAFASCENLTSVTIGTNVTNIGDWAFFNCASLTGVYFMGVAPSVGLNVFYGVNNPTVYYLPGATGWGTMYGGVPTKLWSAFPCTWTTGNGTITITGYAGSGGGFAIPSEIDGLPVTAVGGHVFANCFSLTSLTIGNGAITIGDYAFNNCRNLTSVMIPGVTSIGDYAFESCTSLTNVTIGTNLISIGDSAFLSCYSLTSVTLGTNVTSIGHAAFAGCNRLTRVTIPDSVTSIGEAAFFDCGGLTNVMIGNGVTNIGDSAFLWCGNLTGAYFKGNAPSLGGIKVFNGDNGATVYYLPGTTGWGSSFGGRPTAVWTPQIQTSITSVGVRTNRFGFTITGPANIPVVVEACTILPSASWTSLQSCTLTNGSIYFSDSRWTNYTRRFYRLRSP
jgi:hypothetical protein